MALTAQTQATETSATLQDAAAVDGNGTALALEPNTREVTVKVVGSSAVLNVVFEASFDSGSTYENAFLEDLLSATGISSLDNTISNPGTGRWRYRCPPGVTHLRARIANRLSGSVTISSVKRNY